MSGLSRRTFLAVTGGVVAALPCEGTALAALQGFVLTSRQDIDSANALNFRLFLQNKDVLDLAGVISLRSVDGAMGSYSAGTLFLFPFKRSSTSGEMQAFLPARDAAGSLAATVPMTPGGLPPDEYFCNYVLRAPRHSFIGFSVERLQEAGAERRPWFTPVDSIENGSVGIGWTSSNLNHSWFEGSHWIQAGEGPGGYDWRALIIQGVRQASAMA